MATVNITSIPAPRVPFIDDRTGLMAREWYRFFLNLFVLTGSGGNQVSLDDLQIGPPQLPIGTLGSLNLDTPPTAGGATYGDGSGLSVTAAGTAGQVLISGAASAPAWVSTAAINIDGTVGVTTPATGRFTGAAVGSSSPEINGLTFPIVAVPVSNTRTLDDYLEGTFTPTLSGATTTTYTTQQGTYTKIGRKVFFQCELTINLIGDGSTTAVVLGGLPSSGSTYYGGASVSYFASLATGVVFIAGRIAPGTNTVTMYNLTVAAASIGSSATFGNGSQIIFTGQYEV